MLPATFFSPSPCELSKFGSNSLTKLGEELQNWVRISVANVSDERVMDIARRLRCYSGELQSRYKQE